MNKTKDFLQINAGVLLVVVGVYFFKFPNQFSTGGVSGLAVILSALPIDLSSATIMLLINLAFLVLGFVFLNKEFGVKTIYCTLMISVVTKIFEVYFPMTAPLTDQRMLELIFSVILPGVGSALLFTKGASSGGTDILAMIIRKNTQIDLGKSLLFSDFFISFSTLFFFGVETCMYSLLGLLLKSFIIDNVIENISTKKIAIIITSKHDEVIDFITHVLHRGVTNWECVGGYTGEEKSALMTALSPRQAVMLRDYVNSVDAKSFIVINNSTEVIGKGFQRGY